MSRPTQDLSRETQQNQYRDQLLDPGVHKTQKHREVPRPGGDATLHDSLSNEPEKMAGENSRKVEYPKSSIKYTSSI